MPNDQHTIQIRDAVATPESPLLQLLELCKYEVSVTVNQHRNDYESVDVYLDSPHTNNADIADDVRAEMIRRDTIVDVQAYPSTPIGFYRVLHWDVMEALRLIIDDISADLASVSGTIGG